MISLAVDDQDYTAEWLEKGRVVAAVTGFDRQVTGCRSMPLGSLRYRATASPDFVTRYFPNGVDAAALGRAPAILFNQKDQLQAAWMRKVAGQAPSHASHWLPSTQAFVDAALAGMAGA
jgi:LysR family transcriptional regulator (chromosome initiation inhibitor)